MGDGLGGLGGQRAGGDGVDADLVAAVAAGEGAHGGFQRSLVDAHPVVIGKGDAGFEAEGDHGAAFLHVGGGVAGNGRERNAGDVEGLQDVVVRGGMKLLAQAGVGIGVGDGVHQPLDRPDVLEDVDDLLVDQYVAVPDVERGLLLVGHLLAAVEKDALHALALDGVDDFATPLFDALADGVGNGIRVQKTHHDICSAFFDHKNVLPFDKGAPH